MAIDGLTDKDRKAIARAEAKAFYGHALGGNDPAGPERALARIVGNAERSDAHNPGGRRSR
jgi:hypothetical protein